jgi:valyl-tRNA synthetase
MLGDTAIAVHPDDTRYKVIRLLVFLSAITQLN